MRMVVLDQTKGPARPLPCLQQGPVADAWRRVSVHSKCVLLFPTVFLQPSATCLSEFPRKTCYRVSFSGDIRDPPGQGPVQPAVGDPASAGGLD